MARLREVQATLHRALLGESPVEEAARSLGVSADRLGLYRRFVDHHVRGVLAKNYPAVQALLPEETWTALCDAFVREHPPSAWELNEAVRPFPAWLARREEVGLDGLEPFHVALASFEWEEFATFVHPGRTPDPASLEAPTLNPTLNVFESPCPVVRYMVLRGRGELDEAAPLPTPDAGPEIVLMFRRPEAEVVAYYRGVDDLLFALKVAHDGLEPVEAARAAGLPEGAARAAWAWAVEIGLVLAPPSTPSISPKPATKEE